MNQHLDAAPEGRDDLPDPPAPAYEPMSPLHEQDAVSHLSGIGFLVAVLIGLLGAVVIWVFAPYSACLLWLATVTDSHLPVIATFLLLVIVLAINPLLGRIRHSWRMSRSQLAVTFGIFLMACVLPGRGLLRVLPYSIARVPHATSGDRELTEAYKKAGLRPELFPDRIDGTENVPAAEHFVKELSPGQPVPWKAWLTPLLAWELLLVPAWAMLIGLALILVPQWRSNERLGFPLLVLQRSLIESPRPGRHFSDLLRSRGFWVAVVGVFVLHWLNGMNFYLPESVPAVPLQVNIKSVFADTPLRFMPSYAWHPPIFFLLIGVAFFMPGRVGFSIWFFTIAYGVYVSLAKVYFPPFSPATVRDHRVGCMFVLAVLFLWIGRRHWAHVARCMVRRAHSPEDWRDRAAGWLFVSGLCGMFVWLVWMGNVQWPWALLFVLIALLSGVFIARLVAETGIAYAGVDVDFQMPLVRVIGAHLARVGALAWLGGASMFMGKMMVMFFVSSTIVSPTVMTTHAIQLDDKAGARRQFYVALILIGVCAVGLVICGGTHVYLNYHHGSTLTGIEPLNIWGMWHADTVGKDIKDLQKGTVNVPSHQEPDRADGGFGHLAFGGAVAGLLLWLCMLFPGWPLHPIGLAVADSAIGKIWLSVLIGWSAKGLILRYGGVRLFRAARGLFLGLIAGEILAAAYWAIEPAIRVYLGMPYARIQFSP